MKKRILDKQSDKGNVADQTTADEPTKPTTIRVPQADKQTADLFCRTAGHK